MKRLREELGIAYGKIYWAKIKGYPWWPALVTDDGDLDYWRVKNGVVEYFCQFFGEKYEFAWLTSLNLIEFDELTDIMAKKHPIDGFDLKRPDLKFAISEANFYFNESLTSCCEYFFRKYENHISQKQFKQTSSKKNLKAFDEEKYLIKYNIKPCSVSLVSLKPDTINSLKSVKKDTVIENINSTQSFSNLDDIMPPQKLFPADERLEEFQDSDDFSFNKLLKTYPDELNSSKLNATTDEETQVTILKTDLLRTLKEMTNV